MPSLMHSGAWVPPFIEQLTGISNAMLRDAPPARAVMHEVDALHARLPLVAHNAAFDRGFWQAEAQRADCDAGRGTRVRLHGAAGAPAVPEAPNHRLGTLAALHHLPSAGRAHRALADAEVTAHLLLQIQRDVSDRFAEELYRREVDHGLLMALQRSDMRALSRCVARYEPAEAIVP